jgi:hypothetical protein
MERFFIIFSEKIKELATKSGRALLLGDWAMGILLSTNHWILLHPKPAQTDLYFELAI